MGGLPDVLLACVGGGSMQLAYECEFVDEPTVRIIGVEVLAAFQRLAKLEGIILALETAHAIAHLDKLCPQIENNARIVINCSGRGDKDIQTVAKVM